MRRMPYCRERPLAAPDPHGQEGLRRFREVLGNACRSLSLSLTVPGHRPQQRAEQGPGPVGSSVGLSSGRRGDELDRLGNKCLDQADRAGLGDNAVDMDPEQHHGEKNRVTLSVPDARRRAEDASRRRYPSGEAVIVDRATDVYEDCVVFHWNTPAFALDPDTDDFLIGTPCFLVDRASGAVYEFPGRGPTEEWVDLYRSGHLEEFTRLRS